MRRRCAAGAALSTASGGNSAVAIAYALAVALVIVGLVAACAKPSGEVLGEFQDLGLYEAAVQADPAVDAWSVREHIDGSSGATIQAKTFGHPVPDRTVLLDGKIIAYADGFGQFLVELPAGKRILTGRCEGYKDAGVEVDVEAGKRVYAIFQMEKDL